MTEARLTLIGKPGCHLCDDARVIVREVADEFGVPWVEQNILVTQQLLERYAEDIPVVLIDGEVHAVWRVDPVRLRAALNPAS